jgi:SAM-dependent methyltransferase
VVVEAAEDAIWFLRDVPPELRSAVDDPGVADGARALDVGCGPGVVTGFLAERFPRGGRVRPCPGGR